MGNNNVSLFNGSSYIGSPSSRRVHLEETIEETEGVIRILKKRMLDKTRKEAMLTQQVQQARANEAALKAEVEKENNTQKILRKRIEEAEDRREKLKQQSDNKYVKTLENDKNISSLSMQIRDLNEELNRNLSKERRVTQMLLHAQRKCREMETELADVRHDNQRTEDDVDNKENSKYDLEDKLNETSDIALRDAQRAQVDSVSLEKDLDIAKQDHREVQEALENLNSTASVVMQDLELNQELHQRMKAELERRIEDQERGNEKLVQSIAGIARSEMDLLADIQTEESGISKLREQIEDKSKIMVDTNRRICEIEQDLSEFDRDLAAKRMEIEEANRVLEMFKSQHTILEAQVEKTFEQNRRLEKELGSEETTANDLLQRLQKLKEEESDLRLRLSQGEADMQHLETALKMRKDSEQETRNKLHAQREIVEDLSEQHREASLRLQDMSARMQRKHGMVEKLKSDLQNMEAEYNKAHRDLSVRKNAMQGELDEHEDEVKRLESELSTSDGKLKDMQDLLTEVKMRDDSTQTNLRTKIEEETLVSESLEEKMRNAMHKIRILTSELRSSTERCENADAQLKQNDSSAADMEKINSEESTALTNQLRIESSRRDDEAKALQNEKNELHRLQMTFDEVVQQKQRIGKQIRSLKFESETAANEIESKKQSMFVFSFFSSHLFPSPYSHFLRLTNPSFSSQVRSRKLQGLEQKSLRRRSCNLELTTG